MSRRDMIRASLATPTRPDNGRHARHVKAWNSDPKAMPIRRLVTALADLADSYDDDIKTDGYAGPYYEQIGDAVIKLLSTDVGKGLDLGTVDALIRRMGASGDCS